MRNIKIWKTDVDGKIFKMFFDYASPIRQINILQEELNKNELFNINIETDDCDQYFIKGKMIASAYVLKITKGTISLQQLISKIRKILKHNITFKNYSTKYSISK
jgi:hypothetical protein